MPLSTEQINLISFIDPKVKNILSSGGDEISIMISLADEMPQIKTIIMRASVIRVNQNLS